MEPSRQAQRLLSRWVEEEVISEEQRGRVRDYLAERPTTAFIDAVVRSQVMDEDECLEAVGAALDMPVMDLTQSEPEKEALRALPAPLMRRLDLLPLYVMPDTIAVAVADPFRPRLVDAIREASGKDVQMVLAKRDAITAVLDLFVAAAPLTETAELLMRSVKAGPTVRDWQSLVGDGAMDGGAAPVVSLLDQLFADALTQGASDIHLEPEARRCIIRYRVDGVLRHVFDLPTNAQYGLICRIKSMAGLDIAQRLRPQDGRIHLRQAGRETDLRVSVLPTIHGENVVVRVLDSSGLQTDLEALGFAPDMLTGLRRLLREPYGLLLVTGPTGSGKTTTLYSALSGLASERVNIMTVEDPVEYQLAGIRQTQVNPAAEMTFAAALRTILRQDPDVVMVGEIRDLETARMAIQAAMTGHLVLSTLHTNDAPSSLERLADMGIPSYLVASTVLGVLAQRLVRRPCPLCSEIAPLSEETRSWLESLGEGDWPDDVQVLHATGCAQCRHTGYAGRLGIYELLTTTSPIRRAMASQVSTAELRTLAVQGGMVPLRADGLRKVRKQATTVEEVLRVCLY